MTRMPQGAALLCGLMLMALPATPAAQGISTNTPAPDVPNASTRRMPQLGAASVRSIDPARTFDGSSLAGWGPLGAEWRAQGGEFVGTAGSGDGWLVSSDRFQNLGLAASFRCPAGCETGVLVRAEKDGAQTRGLLISVAEGEFGVFRVTLDAQGKEVERAPYVPPASAPGNRIPIPTSPTQVHYSAAALGAARTPIAIRRDDWNYLEVFVNGNTVRAQLNGAGIGSVTTTNTPDGIRNRLGYGPVALRVGGAPGATVRFREVGIRPLDVKDAQPIEATSPRYRKQQVESMFYSESVAAADMNRDGNIDILSGPMIYYGPDFTRRAEVWTPMIWHAISYPEPLQTDVHDFTGDGYPDILQVADLRAPGVLFVNPGAEARQWARHEVIPSVDNEVSFIDDIDGDGRPEYLYGDEGFLVYAKPGADPTKPWTEVRVTERGPWGSVTGHGLGSGDINGDGRKDLVQAYGWWEQPASGPEGQWTYHPEAFGRWGTQQGSAGGARAYVYDVNGDGLNDVVTSLEAHGFGLAWFEQKRTAGRISFERHMIMDDFAAPANGVTFAALHALTMADIDGDGLQDIITGKRWLGHFGDYPNDPDPFGAPVIYAFRLVREGGQARYVPELIDNNSAVGTQIWAADVNRDGLADVMTATRRGTFVFISQPTGVAR